MSPAPRSPRPRIDPVAAPDAAQREALAKAPVRPDGTTRNIFLTFAHHPMLLKRFNALAGTFFLSGLLSDREREVIVLRVAGRLGSRYEYGQHLAIARDAGMSDDTIRGVLLQEGASPLSEPDALLVRMTDELLELGTVTDATWAALEARYAPPALLELVVAVGFYRMTGDLLQTVGVELEDGDEPDLELDWARIVTTPQV